jgi:hypothetical protein
VGTRRWSVVSGVILTVGVIVGVAWSQGTSIGHSVVRPTRPEVTENATYRASEVLLIYPSTRGGFTVPSAIARATRNADFAPTVIRRGGSAHLSVQWDDLAAAFRVTTTSPNRDDANRTLAIVDSVLRQRVMDDQAGTRPAHRLKLATLLRRNA